MENAKNEIRKALADSKAAREEATDFLVLQGESIDLADWVTAKEYAERFGLSSTNVVTNWIRRGIIPPENIRIIEAFNNLRLVKAIFYKDASSREVA